MTCREFDAKLCEYLDEELDRDERRDMDLHATSCAACAAELREAEFAATILRRTPTVEPPPQLIADIIHDTIGYGGLAPIAAGERGRFGFLKVIFHPFLQPRFVMGMAVTALSFSMLTFYGRRALDAQQPAPDSSAVVLVEGAEQLWEDTTEVFKAAREFYELQLQTAAERAAEVEEEE